MKINILDNQIYMQILEIIKLISLSQIFWKT